MIRGLGSWILLVKFMVKIQDVEHGNWEQTRPPRLAALLARCETPRMDCVDEFWRDWESKLHYFHPK
jgi:hypothetical protein